MTITCDGAQATVSNTVPIASGTTNFFDASFVFDARWNGLTKKVIFRNQHISEEIILTTSSCKIPNAITAIAGDLYVALYGSIVDDENTEIDETVVLSTPYMFVTTIVQGVI